MSGWVLSDEHDKVVGALVKALAELDDVSKKRTANIPGREGRQGFSYEYANITDVLQAARPVLATHGLAVSQSASSSPDGRLVEVWTTFMHESGQWVQMAPLRLPAGNDARSAGGSVTYARRYALMSALGVGGEDDDGATAGSHDTARDGAQSGGNRAGGRAAGARDGAQRSPSEGRSPYEGEWKGWLAALNSTDQREVLAAFAEQFGASPSRLAVKDHRKAHAWLRTAIDEIEGRNAADQGEGYG